MPAALIDTVGRVETPEHVSFEFRLAGPWRRGWAYAIDFVLRAILLFVVVLGLMLTSVITASLDDLGNAFAGVMLLVWFVLEWFYFVLFEWLWAGRTPGKKATGLRVVKELGHPIGFQDAFLRNLLRGADALPATTATGVPLPTYVVGVLMMAFDPRFRRFGDMVAGTIVVVEEPVKLRAPAPIEPPPTPEELAGMPAKPRLSVEERRTLDAFVRRWRMLHPARRDEIAAPLAAMLAKRLGVPVPRSPARLVQLVYARLIEEQALHGAGVRAAPR